MGVFNTKKMQQVMRRTRLREAGQAMHAADFFSAWEAFAGSILLQLSGSPAFAEA